MPARSTIRIDPKLLRRVQEFTVTHSFDLHSLVEGVISDGLESFEATMARVEATIEVPPPKRAGEGARPAPANVIPLFRGASRTTTPPRSDL